MTYQYGDEGIVRTALSGIDIAPWDLVAERHTVPVTELIAADAVDVVQPEVAKFGGLTPARAIGEQIYRVGLQCYPHNYSLGPSWLASWQWASTEPAATWLEVSFLAEGTDFPLEMAMPTIFNGAVDAPSGPGLATRAKLES